MTPDPIDVLQRTRVLSDQALDVIAAKLRNDPKFLCQVVEVTPAVIVKEVWRLCFQRALEEAQAVDPDATRH